MKQPFAPVSYLVAITVLVGAVATAQVEERTDTAQRVSCLEAKTVTEFLTYVVDVLEEAGVQELRACFDELTADSPQLRFFHDLADADDPSGNDRFGAGFPLSVIITSPGFPPDHFEDFLDLVAELESRLIEEDPSLRGLFHQMLNAQDSRGEDTALHTAVFMDLPDHAEILLDAGADAQTIRNEDGLTASELATLLGTVASNLYPNVYSLFKARGIDSPVPDR